MTCDRCGHQEGEHLKALPPGRMTYPGSDIAPCFKWLDGTYCDCEGYLK